MLLLLLVQAGGAFSQRVIEKSIPYSDSQVIRIDFPFADEIKVSGWEKEEVQIRVSVNINDNEDNDAFMLKIDDIGDLDIESEIKGLKELSKGYRISQDENGQVISRSDCINMEIFYEACIPKKAGLFLETISGNVVLTGLSGELEIITISGFVDLAVPENAGIDFELKTITGGMYSDLDLKFEDEVDGLFHVGGHSVDAAMNKGGRLISLKTISGDIYLRKSSILQK